MGWRPFYAIAAIFFFFNEESLRIHPVVNVGAVSDVGRVQMHAVLSVSCYNLVYIWGTSRGGVGPGAGGISRTATPPISPLPYATPLLS